MVQNATKCVQALYPLGALTKRSLYQNPSMVIQHLQDDPLRTTYHWCCEKTLKLATDRSTWRGKSTHAWVGWTLAITERRRSQFDGMILGIHSPPRPPKRAMSFFARSWACSSRGRRAVTFASFRAVSKASRTSPLARSPIAWTF